MRRRIEAKAWGGEEQSLRNRDTLAQVRAFVLPLALVAIFVGNVSASTMTPKTKLLLTIEDLPPDFRVVRPARLVKARTEARNFGVNTGRYGRVAGASSSFKRGVSGFNDRAVNQVDIGLIFFRSTTGAHAAFKALVAKERRLFAVHVGAESAGSGLSGPDVNVRWVWWRHKNVVANVSASYFGGHPNIRSLLALVQKQQSRLARSVR